MESKFSKSPLDHFMQMMNKKQLFEYLDKLRKDNPAEYATFLEKHEDDLREIGYQ